MLSLHTKYPHKDHNVHQNFLAENKFKYHATIKSDLSRLISSFLIIHVRSTVSGYGYTSITLSKWNITNCTSLLFGCVSTKIDYAQIF